MKEEKRRPEAKLPGGTPWSKKEMPSPSDPPVPDPPVPNRAHTEMTTSFPPEFPAQEKKKEF